MAISVQRLASLPRQPGCYIFRSATGAILYVGKAKSLRSRVRSYFRPEHHDVKTTALVEQIADLETIITDTEVEALLLEARLIRDHQPPYNMDLKGGNRYAYIRITNELFPRLETVRTVEPSDIVFGPFASSSARRNVIRLANHVFRLRSSKLKPIKVGEKYQFRCAVPPWKRLTTVVEYQADIARATLLLKGQTDDLLKELTIEMKTYSKNQQYELARLRRDQISALEYLHEEQKVSLRRRYNQDVWVGSPAGDTLVACMLRISKGVVVGREKITVPQVDAATPPEKLLADCITQYYFDHEAPEEIILERALPQSQVITEYLKKVTGRVVRLVVPKQGTKYKLVQLVKKNLSSDLSGGSQAAYDLQQALELPTLPRVIECFDISNLGATHMVGAMVQFRDGEPVKSNYRRFKIKWQRGQSDVAAIYEIVSRRYYRLIKEHSPLPDLIMIDGGKPQLTMALRAVRRLNVTTPLVALAKQEEELFLPGRAGSIKLPQRSDALKLVQRIRDETHRFAITYHRKVRGRALTASRKNI